MTMDASLSEVEHLSSQLFKEELPVTYHTLSRNLGIHTTSAKTILSEFYDKNKDKVSASFIITGKSETGPLIKLSASETKLVEDIKKFLSVNTVHVYCLTPKQNEYTTYSIAFEELKFPTVFDKAQDYYKNGMIRGPEVKEMVRPSAVAPVREAIKSEPASRATTTPATSKPKVKSAGLTSGYVSRKQAAKPATTLSNYKSRKEENTATKRQAESTGAYQYKSRKTEAKTPKERVIVSSVDDGDVAIEDSPAQKADSEALAKMFDDFSDFEEDEAEAAAEKGEPDEQISAPEPEIEETKPSTVEEMFVPEEEEVEENPSSESLAASEPPKEDTVDDDGFVVTYRKPKANQKTAPGDGKKKQASLMSFFSK
ncbi:uncharacterized protein CANTADRAFT_43803 [Suhomyces tanzawaensis NRRL Y-17324]|uniref:DNA polymerase delta subunit 3 n=1 Tax=Suhomyces tanzawaensis NRRL Y-17324 TaxID=984487 RepID=A0A1E4SPE9_9ASCO|nr:uncharacterized protein CANTADRAFT_43803 [Suhomyces tanzawaensis NRRL Y-17324]ODV81401.1 hypothetical protein CANTADRAFT_43803 [Suhomyces tanzawaensis NRRL Y-17324]